MSPKQLEELIKSLKNKEFEKVSEFLDKHENTETFTIEGKVTN